MERIEIPQRERVEIILCGLGPASIIRPWGAIAHCTISAVKGTFPSSTSSNAVDPKSAIVDSQGKLSSNANTEVRPTGVHISGPAGARLLDLVSEWGAVDAGEDGVWVDVQVDTVVSGKQIYPSCETLEGIVDGDERSLSCARAGDVADGIVRLQVAIMAVISSSPRGAANDGTRTTK